MAQDISITLSLSWEKSNLKMTEELDTILHPYLCIEYKNLTSEAIYMPRTIFGCKELPLIALGDFNMGNQKSCFLKEYNDTCCIKLNYFAPSFSIDEDMGEDEVAISPSSSFANIINTYIAHKNGFEYKENNIRIKQSIVENESNYIFLKPHELVLDKFNLIALMILRGSYNFVYNEVPCMVESLVDWNSEKNKYESIDYHFPKMKDGYRLFCGPLVSDSLEIVF